MLSIEPLLYYHACMPMRKAGDGVRTHNIKLGRLALCQLSYTREVWAVRDSNPRPPVCKTDALTATLTARSGPDRDRTGYFLNANQTCTQLHLRPNFILYHYRAGGGCCPRDLNFGKVAFYC